MIEEVKKSHEDELREIQENVSRVWLDWGRAMYERELIERRCGELSTKAHNLNQQALKVHEKIAREKAAERVIEGGLAKGQDPVPGEQTAGLAQTEPSPEVTQ